MELLAPVGSFEVLEKAIAAGCDAVYLAGKQFGARAYAENFDYDNLIEAIKYAHRYGVKVHVTVNTLIFDNEMDEVMDYIGFLYVNDVDAVIVQDLGLASLIHRSYPDFAMHASTQINAQTLEDVKVLKKLGFSRVILGREVSIEEIKRIRDSKIDIELETFIHGALCMSYSGGCYFSSFEGGRSGNRGRCAQPCRKLYQFNGKKGYFLSPKDLCTIDAVKELARYVDSMKILIDYISGYNDDGQECYDLIHDIFELTSCYEIVYENEDNEIIYSKYSPLQTVATWDYKTPSNLTGLVRTWEETDLDGNIITKVELTDKNGIRIYDYDGTKAVLTEELSHNWNDVPAIAVETDFAIFETCEDVISAYEQLIQNMRNTFQYNDTDCKLKISGYAPENPMTAVNEKGEVIVNPARVKEDDAVLATKTFYVSEGGDINWISKPVDASGVQTILKMYQDLMFQLAGIPNTSDLAFNSADLNASAIDRKFYIMNMATSSAVSLLKKALLRRWELIFGRINIKKQTQFDFRDIVVDIPKNLPANDSELAEQMLKLKGLVSDETIVEKLGYNYLAEKEKLNEETDENMLANLERMQAMQGMGIGNDELTDQQEQQEEGLPEPEENTEE